MISYLQVENLTKSFGDNVLFEDISLGLAQGDKVGLIARNGAGKSTLLNIIAGEEGYDSGKITFRNDLRVGYLPQEPKFDSEKSILENFRDFAAPHDENWENNAKRMLGQVGIFDLEQHPSAMSGGQLKRVALARVLFSQPDILILDEPTNHLDISVIEWLEDYLSRQKTTILMVTHDRWFLDNVCNKIIEIDRRMTFTYEGNYDYYLQKRQERMENMSAELLKVKNLLRTELDWMRRQPQARGSKAKYRIDNFYQLEERSKVRLDEKSVNIAAKSSYIGSKIFEAKNVSKAFGDKVILKDWSYNFARYEKVGIVGPNGAGKTTFIRLLLGELAPDSGGFDIGETVRWGYYSQTGMTDFDEKKKVIDAVREIAETVAIDDNNRMTASQFLSQFLFTPDTQQKYIYKLSGGERRRLYLATVLMRRPNFLILDEPTNDLDIVTLSVLEDYLVNFKGCVIVVSHDRFFLDRIVDHVFVFEGDGKFRDFPGNYSEYRHCLKQEQLQMKEESSQTRENAKAGVKPRLNAQKAGLSFKEKREKEELEKDLEELTKERKELEEALSSGTLPADELLASSARISEIIAMVDEKEMRLLELMEKE